jgi:hypothetical protein
MPTFRITFTTTGHGSGTIEAASEEEARAKWYTMEEASQTEWEYDELTSVEEEE